MPRQTWTTTWGSKELLLYFCLYLVLQPDPANPWTVARQAPLSMVFSRQEYWSGLPCPPLEDFPNSGIKPSSLMSPPLAGRFFPTSIAWEALASRRVYLFRAESGKLGMICFLSFFFFLFLIFLNFTSFYFTILYWFCHTSTRIHHGCKCVPLSHLPSFTFVLGQIHKNSTQCKQKSKEAGSLNHF